MKLKKNILKKKEIVKVLLNERSYKIIIGKNISNELFPLLKDNLIFETIFIVTDYNVSKHHLSNLESDLRKSHVKYHVLVLKPGEKSKNWKNLIKTTEWLLENKIERDDLVIAFGGGVIGDLVGFASSITKRGIKFVQVPTTLLAQVDSSVGGKTAINSEVGKNLIGSFYQPSLVICDMIFLKTQNKRDFLSGFSEMVKYGLLGDKNFFSWLENNGEEILNLNYNYLSYAIKKSCEIKASIVEKDEKENGNRALLNLGHTFGHALESDTNYSDMLLHGEGVSIGSVLAFKFSLELGLCEQKDVNRVIDFYTRMGMKTKISDISDYTPNIDRIVKTMYQDKKVKRGNLNLILLKKIGLAFVYKDVLKSTCIKFLEKNLHL